MPRTEPARFDAAYQGAPGAYSELAARRLVGEAAALLPCETLETMFDAVARGMASHAVVPVENCLTGTVPNAYELVFAHDLRAIGETRVQIEHVLVAPPGTAFQQVRRVLSHPVALAQCRRFFGAHPDIEPVAAFDTAGAVEIVMREADGRSAALAARRTATLYGARVIADRFQDHDENWTRFLLVSRPTPAAAQDTGRTCKALFAFELPHAPGSLHAALAPLAAHGVNLTRIQSQPVHGRPFEYRFHAEVTGAAEVLQAALHAMQAVTRGLKTFGTYPLSDGP
jgi:prephenate dehydratase